jgi:hypothetical protein
VLQTIADKLPELRKLEDQVAQLKEGQIQEQNRLANLQQRLAEAEERDLDRTAQALNRGNKAPHRQAPKLRSQFEDSQAELSLLQRRHVLATADRSKYVAEHRDEIISLLVEERDQQARRVAEAARQALDSLLAMFAVEDEGRGVERQFATPQPAIPPATEYSGAALIMGPLTTQNITGSSAPRRGELQSTLEYLISLGSETVVGEGDPDVEGNNGAEAG